MRIIIYLSIGLLIASHSFGQSEQIARSQIGEVTVYKSGARVKRTAEVSLEKGSTRLLIPGISHKMNAESIQASLSKDITIVSVTYELDFLDTLQRNEALDKLQGSLDVIDKELVILDMQKNVYKAERFAILNNSKLSSDEKISVSDIEALANLYRSRLFEIDSTILELDRSRRKLLEQKVPYLKQITEFNEEEDYPTVTVVMNLIADKLVPDSKLELFYNIGEAGWEAFYDARVEDVNTDLGLSYNAKVFQDTGEDWDDVKLSLSTGDPQYSNVKPDLRPFYLGSSNTSYSRSSKRTDFEPVFSENMVSKSNTPGISGRVVEEESGLSAIGATVIVKQDGVIISGAVTDFDGYYQVKNLSPGMYDVEISYVGFMNTRTEGVQLSADRGASINASLYSDSEVLSEMVVVGYKVPLIEVDNTTSGRTISASEISGLEGRVSGVSTRGSRSSKVDYYVDDERLVDSRSEVSKQLTNVVFEVEDAYSIPSNKKPYDVHLLNYSIPADYTYYAAPKIREEAYLIANINNWSDYDLLNGKVNIYFKGVYQGFSAIETGELGDTLSFSVGKDSDILIRRILDKEYSSKSFLGNYVREQKGYSISVRNNKSYPVRMIVEDQIPISQRDNIKIENYEIEGASLDEDTGKVSWNLEVTSQNQRSIDFNYRVRYPKYMRLSLD